MASSRALSTAGAARTVGISSTLLAPYGPLSTVGDVSGTDRFAARAVEVEVDPETGRIHIVDDVPRTMSDAR